MVSGTISLLLSRCFSPFLHSTRTLSVSLEYLALPDGPGGFAQNSSCSALLRIPLGRSRIRVRDFHPLWSAFPGNSTLRYRTTTWSYNPKGALLRLWFGLFPGRSPLLGESRLFSFPRGTKMFQFPRLAPSACADGGCPSDSRVVPFGNPGIRGHLHLPRAYRSLSRPSSPP